MIGMLVMICEDMTVKEDPKDLVVVRRRDLRRWLDKQPARLPLAQASSIRADRQSDEVGLRHITSLDEARSKKSKQQSVAGENQGSGPPGKEPPVDSRHSGHCT